VADIWALTESSGVREGHSRLKGHPSHKIDFIGFQSPLRPQNQTGSSFHDGWPLLFPAFIEIKNDPVGFAE
jgi:hypothetical protein